MEEAEDMHTIMHSYAKKSQSDQFESNTSTLSEQTEMCLAPLPLPETPKSRAAKKSKLRTGDENDSEPVSNSKDARGVTQTTSVIRSNG